MLPSIKTTTFQNFNEIRSGIVVTSWKDQEDTIEVVKSRNPYGSHSLILLSHGKAVRHGLNAILSWAGSFGFNNQSQKSQKKRLRKMLLKNKWRNW